MDKVAIIAFLILMKDVYLKAIKIENWMELKNYNDTNHLNFGMCGYIHYKKLTQGIVVMTDIIDEIKKDDLLTTDSSFSGQFSYPVAIDFSSWDVTNIKAKALQPRIEHLNRTITRLKNELQPHS